MIPREILKKIRQIELRTNRIVTETLAGQDAGAGGLAGAAGAAEKIGRCDPPGAQGVAQGGGNGLLPHQLREPLGAVFMVKGLVGRSHADKLVKRRC